ncbi:MAG: hypothetical protein ACRCUE_01305 [Bosea sp. (in: a-proteobacteria)]
MKSIRLVTLLLGAIIAGMSASPAYAQDKAPPLIQKEYDLFIATFRAALKANDGDAVTALTKFPFHWNEMRDAAYFRKNLYSKIFTPKIRTCLARGKGYYADNRQGEQNFTLICGESMFLFTRTPDGFRFHETGELGG